MQGFKFRGENKTFTEDKYTFAQTAIRPYGSAKAGGVPDANTSSIDRIFDMVDSVVDKADRVLNRTKYTEEQHRTRRAKKPVVIDTASTVKVAKAETSSPSTAIAPRRFRIVEAIAAESGVAIFVVTNGTVRAECSTREMAEKILRAMETAP